MSRQTVLYLAVTAGAATAAFFGGGAIGQSLNDDPSASGCRGALQRTYDAIEAETEAGGDPGKQPMPPECMGVDDATMERYGAELIEKELGDSFKDAWSSPTPTP